MTNTQKWFLIAAMWIGLLFILLTFYWFQIRPVNVRKICSGKADKAAQAMKPNLSNIHEFYRAVYSDCCRNNGLKE
jgi:hypothetical protein